jgi:restriction system protein
MACEWWQYQEETAMFFRELGLNAETNVPIQGVRTSHDVDVVVRSRHVGFDVLWLVECKHWKKKVSKLHVLALREIVADTGADRGILLSEEGFQSGAIEAASLTNVQATSLASLRKTTTVEVTAMRLRELFDRNESCKERYWDIPKDERIAHGLRDEMPGYSGARIVEYAADVLAKALRGVYPVETETPYAFATPGARRNFSSAEEVVAILEPIIRELEARIASYESKRVGAGAP